MNRIMIAALALSLAGPAFAGTMNRDQGGANAPAVNTAGSSMPRDYKVRALTLSDKQQKAIWESVANTKSQPAPKKELKIGLKIPQSIELKALPQQAKNQLGVVAEAYQYAKVGDRVVLAERRSRRVAEIISE